MVATQFNPVVTDYFGPRGVLIVAVAAMLLATAAWFAIVAAAKHSERQSMTVALEELRQSKRQGSPEQTDATKQSVSFDQYLVPSSDVELIISQVAQLGRTAGLELSSGTYSRRVDPETGLSGVEMAFSLNSDYPRVRSFIATVMNNLPIISMREIRISRQHHDTLNVQAEVSFGVYLKPQGERS